jgi:hypothetical protein
MTYIEPPPFVTGRIPKRDYRTFSPRWFYHPRLRAPLSSWVVTKGEFCAGVPYRQIFAF